METAGKKPTVFIVDDDKVFLQSLRYELAEKFKNIRLNTFSNGEECLDHISESPDVVILDYYLDGSAHAMNGIQVLKEIKSLHPAIEVIILSAQDKLEVAANAIKAGAFEYITKSETAFVRLFNTLRKALNSIETTQINKKFVLWNYAMAAALLAFVAFLIIFLITRVRTI